MVKKHVKGFRIGKMEIIDDEPVRPYNYKFTCDCGATVTRNVNQLRARSRKGLPVSCGCDYKRVFKDITGKKSGKLTALENTFRKSGNRDYIWKFLCDCGNTTETTIGRFNSKHTRSCGCLIEDIAKQKEGYHGMTESKPYKSWCKIKERCNNKNVPNYKDYGGKGITISDEFADNFLAFYEEVGDPPEDTYYYSIDRIDGTKGYERGNMRWATRHQQARNKGMSSNNTTGFKGVLIDKKSYKLKSGEVKYLTYAKAVWRDLGGVARNKLFSFDKYGEELALFLAQEYRITMMERLNLLGAGYSHYHLYGEVEEEA